LYILYLLTEVNLKINFGEILEKLFNRDNRQIASGGDFNRFGTKVELATSVLILAGIR
jgi:hypothetical protein